MEKSSKRGKIPQQDWPSIITRYEAGETLASIARTYDCSPPAISYIVSRTRARNAAGDAGGQTGSSAAEPQLIKGPGPEIPAAGIPASDNLHDPSSSSQTRLLDVAPAAPRLIEQPADAPQQPEQQLFPDQSHSHSIPVMRERGSSPVEINSPQRHAPQQAAPGAAGNGSSHSFGLSSAPPHNDEPRRRLHLPLPPGNGGAHGSDQVPGAQGGSSSGHGPGAPAVQRAPGWQQGSAPVRPGSDHAAAPAGAIASGAITPHRERESGAFIDHVLRERVEGDITAFLAAFDAALAHDTPESRTGLREATDRLLRAGARTRIELERLEARAPLPLRDKNDQAPPLYRR